MSVIEVAEAAGEHSDLFGETLSKIFGIPDLYVHQNCPHYLHFCSLKKARYSRVHISSNEVFFQDSEETIHNAEINDTSYERLWSFH